MYERVQFVCWCFFYVHLIRDGERKKNEVTKRYCYSLLCPIVDSPVSIYLAAKQRPVCTIIRTKTSSFQESYLAPCSRLMNNANEIEEPMLAL